MPLYVFDLNEGDSPEWDDEKLECEGRAEIERHALLLIEEAGNRLSVRGAENLLSTVVVSEPDGEIVMSAHGRAGGPVRVLWRSLESGPQVAAQNVREHARGILLDLIDRLSEARRGKTKP